MKFNTDKTKLPVSIVIFKGGGYDGCFWEWNALILDKEGISPDSVLSGYKGKEFKSQVEKEGLYYTIRDYNREQYRDTSKAFIIKTGKQWELANKEFNKGFIRDIARAADLPCSCDKCGRWKDADYIYHTGYKGNGGIGVEYDDNHCEDCAAELHEEWFAENEWKYMKLADRVEAIQKMNRDSGGQLVSVFAARHDDKCPIWASDAESYPDLY